MVKDPQTNRGSAKIGGSVLRRKCCKMRIGDSTPLSLTPDHIIVCRAPNGVHLNLTDGDANSPQRFSNEHAGFVPKQRRGRLIITSWRKRGHVGGASHGARLFPDIHLSSV